MAKIVLSAAGVELVNRTMDFLCGQSVPSNIRRFSEWIREKASTSLIESFAMEVTKYLDENGIVSEEKLLRVISKYIDKVNDDLVPEEKEEREIQGTPANLHKNLSRMFSARMHDHFYVMESAVRGRRGPGAYGRPGLQPSEIRTLWRDVVVDVPYLDDMPYMKELIDDQGRNIFAPHVKMSEHAYGTAIENASGTVMLIMDYCKWLEGYYDILASCQSEAEANLEDEEWDILCSQSQNLRSRFPFIETAVEARKEMWRIVDEVSPRSAEFLRVFWECWGEGLLIAKKLGVAPSMVTKRKKAALKEIFDTDEVSTEHDEWLYLLCDNIRQHTDIAERLDANR